MDELEKYIEENDYSNWTEEEWQKAERDWADAAQDSEEYRKLDILRKQHQRKLFDEKIEREIFLRRYAQCAMRVAKQSPLPNVLMFENIEDENYLKQQMEKPYGIFNDILEKFMKQKGIPSDYALCKAAKLEPYVLSRMRNSVSSVRERDHYWVIAIALGLSLAEKTELFLSCGIVLFSTLNDASFFTLNGAILA